MSTAATTKKARAPARPATYPPFKAMVEKATVALSVGRQKASRQAIQKYIFAYNRTVEENVANRKNINHALARMATSGAIARKSGTGASGSLRPAAKPTTKPAGKKKAAKTPSTPKKKKPLTKKPTGASKAKSLGKKTSKPGTKKATKANSPGKKPAAKKPTATKKAGAAKRNPFRKSPLPRRRPTRKSRQAYRLCLCFQISIK